MRAATALTRYGERSASEWMLADYYRYRVAMPGP